MNHNSVMNLQYDWDGVLWKLEGEAWISYKIKDEKSIQGKLRCTQITSNGLPKLTASSGFSVEKVSRDSLQVKFKDAPFATTFIAASKVYSGIHKKGITSLDISPKGLSVSACKDNQLVVWDFNQGELKCTLAGHVGDVYKCKFFPSGAVVLSGGADMQLKIWCALTGACPVTLVGHTMAVTDFDFIGKGKNVLSVSKDGLAKLWCCASGSCIADVVKLSSTINCCQVFTAPASLPLGQPESEQREEEVDTEDKIVLLGCEDGSVHCVAIQSRKTLFSFSCKSPVNSLTFVTDSHFVVGCQSGELLLHSVDNPSEPVKSWYESNSAVLCVVRYNEGGHLSSHADGSVVFRHVGHPDKRVVLTGPDCDPVYQLCAEQQFIYTCSRDALIRRYTVERVICSFLEDQP
uniref:Uncharacterized protein n=1 Tax=Graphocephala atropunctata TaxID=36148 RepID=A0A1B6KVJ0_9HEMI